MMGCVGGAVCLECEWVELSRLNKMGLREKAVSKHGGT